MGAEAFVCEDLQRELVEEVVFKAIMCNASFEERYLLGTALARPVIARSQVRNVFTLCSVINALGVKRRRRAYGVCASCV